MPDLKISDMTDLPSPATADVIIPVILKGDPSNYKSSASTVLIMAPGFPVTIKSGDDTGAASAADVTIISGDSFTDGLNGGSIRIFAGGSSTVFSTPGDVLIAAGSSNNISGDIPGGALTLKSGTAENISDGGLVTLQAGDAGSGDGQGGSVHIISGTGWTTGGGVVQVVTGSSNGGQGGDFVITLGVDNFSIDRQGLIIVQNMPTADPGVTGALWVDTGTNTVMISP